MDTVSVFCPQSKKILSFEKQVMIAYGFRAFGRILWSDAQVDNYNRYTHEINRATYLPDRDILLNRRHSYFVDTTQFNAQKN